MSTVPNPARTPTPERVAPGPAIVPPAPRKPRNFALWAVLAIVVAGGAALFVKFRPAKTGGPGGTRAAIARTAVVGVGDLDRTIRVSGVVAAEHFAAILAPRLQGSRRGRGRGGSSMTSSSSGSSSTSTSRSSGSTVPGSVSSTTSSNVSSLGAKRGSVNRFSDKSGTSSRPISPSTSSSRSSGSSADLGSTSGSLLSRSGGGGGGSDFHMVLQKLIPAGSHVKKGEIVAEFDRQYQLLRLDDYKDSVVQLEANIKKLKADLMVAKEAHDQLVKSAKADLDKALLDLKTISVRSAIEAEQYKLAAEEAQARYKQVLGEVKLFDESQEAELRNSEIDLEQAKIEYQRAQNNVEKLVVRAPLDGVAVMQTIWRSGQFGQVQEGDQIHAGQFFMSIVDPSSMVIDAIVNQVDAEDLRIGMRATARFDAYPGLALPATVYSVGAMTKPGGWRADYVREIPIRLKLNQMDPRVIPDLSASSEILLGTESRATIAPLAAVFQDNAGDRPFVFLRSPSGWERREVEIGPANNIAVAIRSGLQKGDVVALDRPVQEKQQVTIGTDRE